MADIRRSDNALELGLGATYLDYREKVGGSTLDSEKGWLPTIDLSATFLTDTASAWTRNVYGRLEVMGAVGQTGYDGANFFTGASLHGDTDTGIVEVHGRLGRGFELGEVALLTPFAELGFRYWERDAGYDETYRHGEVLGGLLLHVTPAERWMVSLDAAAGATFAQRLDVDGPLHEDVSLGNEPVYRADAKVGYALSRRWELTTTARLASFSYGRSSTQESDIGPVFEPHSDTWQTSLLLGVAWRFGGP